MAPATHRRRDSEHKNIKCTANGLSLSAWLTWRGFSNILAVFSLYKICKKAIIIYRVYYAYKGYLPAVCQRQSPKIWGCHLDVLWWQSPSNYTKLATILRQKWATRALRSQFFYLSLCDQPETEQKRETQRERERVQGMKIQWKRDIKLRGNPSKSNGG